MDQHRPELILLKAMELLLKAEDSVESGMPATAKIAIREAHALIGSITLADLN